MKYFLELTLHKPRAEVWMAFNDPDRLSTWQPSLVRIDQMEGLAGQTGSVKKLTFRNGEREYALTETITGCIQPKRLDQLYQNEFADNTIRNHFTENGNDETLWKVEVDFKFKTLFMRVLGPFVKKRFVANTQRDMERFKTLVEGS